jgi:Uma2 family endonuclease
MLRDAPIKTAVTFEEFLEFEAHSQERHEFVDGNLFVMAGGSSRHNFLKDEVHAMWRIAVRTAGCQSWTSDMLVRTPSTRGYYPDVITSCERVGGKARELNAPSVIVEVLSPTTEPVDRGEKWQAYQTIPSLEQYVLLSQDEPIAEVFSRLDDGSWRYEKFGVNDKLKFPSFGFELLLEELYRDLPAA